MSEGTYWRLDGKIIVDSEKKFIKCTRCPCITSSSSSSRSCVPGAIKESVLISVYEVTADWYEDDAGELQYTNCRLRNTPEESYTFTLDSNSEPRVKEVEGYGCITGGTYVHTCTYGDYQYKSYIDLEFTEAGKLYSYGYGDDGCAIGMVSMWSFPFVVTNSPEETERELCTLADMYIYACTVT